MKTPMMRFRTLLPVLVLSAAVFPFLVSCSSAPNSQCDPSFNLSKMQGLRVEDAALDATKAHANSDNRLLGINGYVLDVPGVEASVVNRSRVKPIEGTSDALCTQEQGDLIENAKRYAKAYNQKMASYSD